LNFEPNEYPTEEPLYECYIQYVVDISSLFISIHDCWFFCCLACVLITIGFGVFRSSNVLTYSSNKSLIKKR
jgi:hypothetical protein